MDRFRFRVFDNINKRYEKDLTMIDKDGDICYQDGGKYCNGEHPEDFTIEQCTGLKDKNGKLIYEGDVVDINGEKANVIWRDTAFYYHFAPYRLEVGYINYCLMGVIKGTVIGNIHETEEEDE